MKEHSGISILLMVLFMSCGTFVWGDANGDLEAQIRNVAHLKGKSYVDGRARLEAQYRQEAKSFEELAQTTGDWQVRLLCGIVAERVAKAEAIAEYLKEEPKLQWPEGWERQYIACGRALAEKGEDIPMFLVERFWRVSEFQNAEVELVGWESRMYAQNANEATLARALGHLKMKEARELLESALDPRFYVEDFDKKTVEEQKDILKRFSRRRSQVAAVLGEIGSPLSVPTLLDAMEMQDRFDSSSIVGAGLAVAIGQCADKSTLPVFRGKASTTEVASMKEYLERKIRALEQSEK